MKIGDTNFTHKGWLGFAPIYMTDPEKDMPKIISRSQYLEWTLTAATFMFQTLGLIGTIILPGFEPGFPIRVTGKV